MSDKLRRDLSELLNAAYRGDNDGEEETVFMRNVMAGVYAPRLKDKCKKLKNRIKELESLLVDCIGELACIPHSVTGSEDRSTLCAKIQAALRESK